MPLSPLAMFVLCEPRARGRAASEDKRANALETGSNGTGDWRRAGLPADSVAVKRGTEGLPVTGETHWRQAVDAARKRRVGRPAVDSSDDLLSRERGPDQPEAKRLDQEVTRKDEPPSRERPPGDATAVRRQGAGGEVELPSGSERSATAAWAALQRLQRRLFCLRHFASPKRQGMSERRR